MLIPPGIAQLAAPGALGPDQAEQLVPVVLAVVYSGVLAAAVANVVVFNGVRLLGPTRVITLQSFVPPMAVVLAFVFLARADPARPGRRWAIIVLGVALTRLASHAARDPMTFVIDPAVPPPAERRTAPSRSSSTTTGRSP